MGKKHRELVKFSIRAELLGKFNMMRATTNDVLPVQWLYDTYLPTLSPKEEKIFEEVISEMLTEGVIEYAGGAKPTYRLTAKGEDLLCWRTLNDEPPDEARDISDMRVGRHDLHKQKAA